MRTVDGEAGDGGSMSTIVVLRSPAFLTEEGQDDNPGWRGMLGVIKDLET